MKNKIEKIEWTRTFQDEDSIIYRNNLLSVQKEVIFTRNENIIRMNSMFYIDGSKQEFDNEKDLINFLNKNMKR